ncbi:replication initiation protein [Gallibacterium anatis]|uniref:Replication protein n=1 Tax=Gallibacterium anatis TaxID=750 RepID=A0A1A7P702_9PAST|nr:replication initiation protein [Gallibacterium anatis]OBW97090.1 replication protein [Gallibacterium anatis]OBW97585.1 replication protein [Gallibacterium anatis]
MSNELTISKANSFVEASYSMTLDEMRVLSLTLGVFDPTNPKRGFDFTVAEFCKHFPEVNPDIAYVQVQKAIRKISSRWMTLQNDDRILHEVAFVTDRVYFKKEGRFYIEFHEKLLPYIANLKARYTKYELVNIGAFTSTHTIRLYELCSQYKTVGEREIKLEELKDWLQVSDKYDRYNNFNQRVLEPSIAEINAKSDLLIKIEPIKRGRSITALNFTIKTKKSTVKNEQKRPPFPHKNKYGKYVHLDKQNPKMSSHEYSLWARDCLKILDDFYQKIEDVTIEDLRNYWVFLASNASFKSKLGNTQKMLEELRKRGFKLVECDLVEIDKKQADLVDELKE